MVFVDVFVSKIRPIGSSYGLIIPKEVVEEEKLEFGNTVKVGIIKQNLKLLDKLAGTIKGATPFERDRRDWV